MSEMSERLDTTDNRIQEIREDLYIDLVGLFNKYAELAGRPAVAKGIRDHGMQMFNLRAAALKVKKDSNSNSAVSDGQKANVPDG